MNDTLIFVLQVAVSLVAFGLIARWYVAPWLETQTLKAALTPLLLFHLFRTLGLAFVTTSVVPSPLPDTFALPAAAGDLLAVTLAAGALAALRLNWRWTLPLVWLFNIAGVLDFLWAFTQGPLLNLAADYRLGAAWFIPTFYVPAAVVIHGLIFVLLVRRSHEYHSTVTQVHRATQAV